MPLKTASVPKTRRGGALYGGIERSKNGLSKKSVKFTHNLVLFIWGWPKNANAIIGNKRESDTLPVLRRSVVAHNRSTMRRRNKRWDRQTNARTDGIYLARKRKQERLAGGKVGG